jgi:hypothetical protein
VRVLPLALATFQGANSSWPLKPDTVFYSFMPLFEASYHWSPVITSVHILPTGTFSALVAGVSSKLVEYVNPKWTILGGLTFDIIATFLLPFANSKER